MFFFGNNRCFQCKHWSGNSLRNLQYKKSFKFFRLKYWKFVLSKNNIFAVGVCGVTLINEDHDIYATHGYNSCLFDGVREEIADAKKTIKEIKIEGDDE